MVIRIQNVYVTEQIKDYSSWKLLTEWKYYIQGKEQAALILYFSHYKEVHAESTEEQAQNKVLYTHNHIWTSLPQHFVEVKTAIAFKTRIDKKIQRIDQQQQ